MSWRELAFLAVGVALICVAFLVALELLEEKHTVIVGMRAILLSAAKAWRPLQFA